MKIYFLPKEYTLEQIKREVEAVSIKEWWIGEIEENRKYIALLRFTSVVEVPTFLQLLGKELVVGEESKIRVASEAVSYSFIYADNSTKNENGISFTTFQSNKWPLKCRKTTLLHCTKSKINLSLNKVLNKK